MIPDTDDIRQMRHRAKYATLASQDRRRSARPVRDGFSDALILAAIVALLALLVLTAVGTSDAPAAQQEAARPAQTERERILTAWCPAPAAMPRRHCVAWMAVAQCETGGQQRAVTAKSLRQIRWSYDGASGYDGGLQFGQRTWRGNIGRVAARKLTRSQRKARERGAYGLAHGAPAAVQVLAAEALRVRPDGGMGHWPSCGGRW